ncbi:FAD/NAD(P)-binding protein [Streptomyces sp. NPDC056224]|uniref:FAD/NAD(P)-binding protein n=1 Tax=Streptomyces sp. NPDC056224 TaxID=3345750 RepID=UPI0035E0E17E
MKFAIIGGGATGVSLADALARRGLTHELDLVIYEPGKEIGQGNAYRPDLSSSLLNGEIEFMSIRRNEPRHFQEWLSRHHDPQARKHARSGSFAPRHLFGDYVSDSFGHLEEAWHANGRPIEVITQSAVHMSLATDGARVRLTAADGSVREYDGAALCVGTTAPADFYGLAGHLRYTHDPYPLRITVETIDPNEHVTVLGTGLTAVDIVLALLHRGHRGPITMVSRRGLLPGVRQRYRDLTASVLTDAAVLEAAAAPEGLSLAAVLRLMCAELEAHGIAPEILSQEADPAEAPADRLARHLDLAEREELWHPLLINAANDLIELVWSRWSDTERHRYLREYHHVFQSLVHPMPMPTAGRLLSAIEAGQLRVTGGVEDVTATTDGFTVTCRDTSFTTDAIINSAKSEKAAPPTAASALCASVVGAGLGKYDPFGGLTIDTADNRLIPADSSQPAPVFALGQLAAGCLYYTSSLGMITRRVEMVADHVAATVLSHTRKQEA